MASRRKPRVIRIHQLKPGDRFSFIPAAWHGPGVVRESYGTRTLLPDAEWTRHMPKSGKKRVDGTWCIKFDNKKVVNPPGVSYDHPETRVRLLRWKRTDII
jgi:hypothetical protein